jgi:Ca2+-binding EF-hand superfamily protein
MFKALTPNADKLSMDDTKRFLAANFKRLDPDNDGTLELKELQAPIRAALDRAPATDKPWFEHVLQRLQAEFKELDPDNDGTVDQEEYERLLQKRFDAANPDKDNTLERDELQTPAGQAFLILLEPLLHASEGAGAR